MKIVKKEILTDNPGAKVSRLEVVSPDIAEKVEPGQFVVLMVSPEGERIPLTVVDTDRQKGTISLIFQEVGLTTKLLGKLNPGDSLYALAGPLGHPTEIKNFGKVILVGGGVGIAEIYPVARALKQEGNQVITILGARTKELLILEEELKGVSNKFYITTDDGSYGRKGFTTDILTELLMVQESIKHFPIPLRKSPKVIAEGDFLEEDKYGLVYAVGPIPMMQKVAQVTHNFKVKTVVSLNALMVDATGMCGCCRVDIGGETKFSCVDGPEFDADLVDWDGLIKRNRIYIEKEKHICNLYKL